MGQTKMNRKIKILENMIRTEVRKQINESNTSEQNLIDLLKKNKYSGYGSLFYVDSDNKIIYIWPEDVRLIKPAIKVFLNGLAKLGYEYQSKSKQPSKISNGKIN